MRSPPPLHIASIAQIRLTVIHELGHYFGLDEEQLKDV
jgi:predicted Zn-dependent protease with MMP-like domain